MRQCYLFIIFICSLYSTLIYAEPMKSIDQLLEKVNQERIIQDKQNKYREAQFNQDQQDQAKLLKTAQQKLIQEKRRLDKLKRTFAHNELTLAQLTKNREVAQGDLGEMFGVVKGEARNFSEQLAHSIISAQYPDRIQLINALGMGKQLPTIDELTKFWQLQLFELAQSGKVVSFPKDVISIDGDKVNQQITRVGTFNLLADDKYVVFNPELNLIQELSQQPSRAAVNSVNDFIHANVDFASLYIDPSRGALLNVFTQKASLQERIEAGGIIGYIIIALFIFGVIIAMERLVTLYIIGRKVTWQRNNIEHIGNNPLGRILGVYQVNKSVSVEVLERQLDDAILKETPALEVRIPIIKVLAAIAPMLGLLGTVTGMIATFQSIQLFGTGDPKLMAGGISMALMTTVEGLIAALPLMLLHAIVVARSKSIVQILEQQSAGIIATHAEKRSH